MLTDLTRQSFAGLRILLVLTLLLGVVYPLTVWVAGRALAERADGQPVTVDGKVVGSRLLGQSFTGEQWFHSRPSANDYDTLASAPSNLGPSNPDLLAAIEQRRKDVAAFEDVAPDAVPADALTASGSGLDPHISTAYALLQVDRVAAANGLPAGEVRKLVEQSTDGPQLGFLGVEGVNVLELNIAVRDAAR